MPDKHIYNMSISDLIAPWANKTPDAIALLAPHGSPITYSRLLAQIDNTFRKLNSIGIGRNDRVALVIPNGLNMAAALISVVSAATCAPLNPAYSTQEFAFYLSDLKVKALIIPHNMDSPSIDAANELDIPIIHLIPSEESQSGIFSLEGGHTSIPHCPGLAQPEDYALVLHPSGTTSRPKIVPLTHSNICAAAYNILKVRNLKQHDRCLNVMPLFHLHGLAYALLASLMGGGSTICAPGFDSTNFFDWLDLFQPTWYTAVPTIHQSVLARGILDNRLAKGHSLRFIGTASAPMPLPVLRELGDFFDVPVIECYGMTETSGQITCNPLPPGKRKPGSVGLAVGTEVAIMDEADNLLPPDKIGEIVVKGPTVMRGYEDNPEANAKSFANGWLRTGDQGFLDSDGYLFITGRFKEIIIRGAENISPREIDDVLLEHPAILQAAAFGIPHRQLGEDVAAAVVLCDNASATEAEIQKFVSERIAEHKVPSRIIIVDDIPKSSTGKIKRSILAEKLGFTQPVSTKRTEKAEYMAPRNPIEEKLCDIWAETLKVDRIGVNDNFFDLGGSSLQATRIILRMTDAFDINVPIKILLQLPTVADMALIIDYNSAEEKD